VRVVAWRHIMLGKAILIEASATQAGFVPAGVRYLSESYRRRASCSAAEIDPSLPSTAKLAVMHNAAWSGR
jgi:hypothetical protein